MAIVRSEKGILDLRGEYDGKGLKYIPLEQLENIRCPECNSNNLDIQSIRDQEQVRCVCYGAACGFVGYIQL